MKILHICFSCFYIDNYSYQENILVREGVRAGHDVLVLSSTESYDENGNLTYLPSGRYLGSDGADVIRLPYKRILPKFLMKKLRAYSGAYKQICIFNPDVILFHGLCAWELLTILKYKKKNPNVKLYLDSHEDFYNSARNFISKYILHYLFYRAIFRKSIKYVEKILCISLETIDFVVGFYGCPRQIIEYFPLGGTIYSDEEYQSMRDSVRMKYGIKKTDVLFFQSGKFDKQKKLLESLEAFISAPYSSKARYLVAGVMQEEVKHEVEAVIEKDDRITFLGWKSSEEMAKLLCAADVYVQPGTQSATLQASICCRCAVIVADVLSHHPFVKSNGWLIKSEKDLKNAFSESIKLCLDNGLADKKLESLQIARNLLDYEKMAKKLMD